MSDVNVVAPPVDASNEPELNGAALTMLIAALVTMIGPILYYARTPRTDTGLASILLVAPSILIAFGAARLLTIKQHPELLTLGTATFDVIKNVLATVFMFCGSLKQDTRNTLALESLFTECALVGLV